MQPEWQRSAAKQQFAWGLAKCNLSGDEAPQTNSLLYTVAILRYTNVASNSSSLAVAVPTLPTTIPAAWLARFAASSIVAPAARAAASVAMTVSPAPVTS